MKTYTIDEMKQILAEHGKWLRGEGGISADLRGAYLRSADLSSADLRGAYLSGADLRSADLRGADLRGADLRAAYLRSADLRSADLRSANLSSADLSSADLRSANLSSADLRSADLSGSKPDEETVWPHFQIPAGDLIVYKKVAGLIVTLAIPKDAKRTASLVGRKCRAEYALVLDIEGHESVSTNNYGPTTVYEEGKEVRPDSYDDDFKVECSHGIHFFLTRKEAEEWE